MEALESIGVRPRQTCCQTAPLLALFASFLPWFECLTLTVLVSIQRLANSPFHSMLFGTKDLCSGELPYLGATHPCLAPLCNYCATRKIQSSNHSIADQGCSLSDGSTPEMTLTSSFLNVSLNCTLYLSEWIGLRFSAKP